MKEDEICMLSLDKRLKIPKEKKLSLFLFNLVFFQAWLAQIMYDDLRELVPLSTYVGYVALVNILVVVSRTSYLSPQ